MNGTAKWKNYKKHGPLHPYRLEMEGGATPLGSQWGGGWRSFLLLQAHVAGVVLGLGLVEVGIKFSIYIYKSFRLSEVDKPLQSRVTMNVLTIHRQQSHHLVMQLSVCFCFRPAMGLRLMARALEQTKDYPAVSPPIHHRGEGGSN